jgi:transaldolase
MRLENLRVKIFADGADRKALVALNRNPLIRGMTTNPTLMRKAGLSDYESFAREVLEEIRVKPISFEVFADDFGEMRRQALKIRAWQDNVFVKIPVTNTSGESSRPLIEELVREGVKVNVTAMLTLAQVRTVAEVLSPELPAIVSVFAGRIADTGVDPVPLMRAAGALLEERPRAELLWASVREVLNIFQADACGSDIVTVTHDILEKALKTAGCGLAEMSLDTVRMFAKDAEAAGFRL